MLKLQIVPRFCRNGWNGPLRRGPEIVSAAICGRKSSRAAARASQNSLLKRVLPFFFLAALFLGTASYAGQANVFVYHRFNDPRFPSTNISLENFRAHLEVLKANDFKVLTLGEIVKILQADEALPPRCAAITIDDAFRTFLTDGWPLLKEYGYPATLFVSTDSVGGGSYLGWDELKLLHQDGVEIGNHSAAHAYMLNGMVEKGWIERSRKDLERSQRAFQANLGYLPKLFAYPYGEYSPELVKLVKQAGFAAAFGQQSGVIAKGQDLFSLPRFPMGAGYVSLDSFREKLFVRHLPLDLVASKGPIVKEENPPSLKFYLNNGKVASTTLRCFVQGQGRCQIELLDERSGLYRVKAEFPLKQRRSKYTVTASDQSGKNWFWFSQLWVLPRRDSVTDNSIP
jgi:peptidoglycan/xylan/chitin deacetylase (PgdA/CDA1 family)